jgi:hypothetical protein
MEVFPAEVEDAQLTRLCIKNVDPVVSSNCYPCDPAKH